MNQCCTFSHSSHAPRSVTLERHWLHSHAERGNDINIEAFENKVAQLVLIYQQKLTALNELKQSILQKAFTGELIQKEENS